MDLPIFSMVLEEDSELGLDAIALVEVPAIQKNFIAFNEHKQMLSIQSEEKKIISGCLLLADVPVYRNHAPYGEHYVTFSAENIRRATQKFFKQGLQSQINLSHDPEKMLGGVTLFESYLVDRSQNKLPMKGFEDAKDGSWFGSMKVDNEQVWQSVKMGEVKGFSIEGFFGYQKLSIEQKPQQDDVLAKIKELLLQYNES